MIETLEFEALEWIDEEASPRPPSKVWSLLKRIGRAIASGLEWIFGAVSLVIGLSVLAALPIAQFLSLGYLLEASGRVARSGRVRDGWIGVRRAARVGSIVAGAWLSLLPSRLVSSLATSAELIDPDSPVARSWRGGLAVVVVLTLVHVAASCARGGRLRHFAWPPGSLIWLIRRLRRGGLYADSRDATWAFVEGLRLPHYFRQGFLGFMGSSAWLAVPVTLLALGRRVPPLGLLGALGLGIVAMSLPFLQVRFAVEGRFAALFGVKEVRERFRRAPWAFALAFLLTVVAAIPLYLLKIELVPREATWLPSLLFVAFLAPSRLACGWAYARGGRREDRRHWAWRGIGRLAMVPVAGFYVLIVFLAQYTSWGGVWDLYEQHAFLLPVPFLGY
jgi:uncharacterized membrane protein